MGRFEQYKAAHILAYVCSCLILFCSCRPMDKTPAKLSFDREQTGQKVAELTENDREALYHMSVGAEFLPFALVKSVRVEFQGKVVDPFDDGLVRSYGLIPAPASSKLNPERLPVGLSLAVAAETGLMSIGLTCAACHVSEIRYEDAVGKIQNLRLDGAGSHGRVQEYLNMIMTGLEQNTATLFERTKFLARASTIKTRDQLTSLQALTAMRRFVSIATMAKSDQGDYSRKTSLKAADYIDSQNIPDNQKRLLFARYRFLQAALSKSGYANHYGPGRTDPWVETKLTLLSEYGFKQVPNGPVKIPRLYHSELYPWFHFYGNTNGILERNAGNTLGVGALADIRMFPSTSGDRTPTYSSTINFDNLRKLERLFWKISPPQFPKDVKEEPGRLAAGLDVKACGRQIYEQLCQNCHEPREQDGLYEVRQAYSIEEIGTDSQYTRNFKAPIKTSKLNIKNLNEDFIAPEMAKLKQEFYRLNKISIEDQRVWEDTDRRGSEVWRDPALRAEGRHVRPRPLDGVWASAPFLHNGSVPTLKDLLLPANLRPKKFFTGHSLYDLEKVGLATVTASSPRVPDATYLFDTTKIGNSNAGHEFGVNLPESHKEALLEFLKGFGAGGDAPTLLPRTEGPDKCK